MKQYLAVVPFCLLAISASATVQVYVEDVNGSAWIKYRCTGGEVVRAFALDVTVNRGVIQGVSDFFRGESTASGRGYGIFPASFRDHITISSGTNVDWNVNGYTPLAVVADRPADTRLGLNSPGVTLEFGALWDASVQAAAPDASGTLCALQISEPASVSITANQARGGIVSASADNVIVPVFGSAAVDPKAVITGIILTNRVVTITFKGGELETAAGLSTIWIGTGNSSGTYSESVGTATARFYRVRRK
jgi:hypothetical protein